MLPFRGMNLRGTRGVRGFGGRPRYTERTPTEPKAITERSEGVRPIGVAPDMRSRNPQTAFERTGNDYQGFSRSFIDKNYQGSRGGEFYGTQISSEDAFQDFESYPPQHPAFPPRYHNGRPSQNSASNLIPPSMTIRGPP